MLDGCHERWHTIGGCHCMPTAPGKGPVLVNQHRGWVKLGGWSQWQQRHWYPSQPWTVFPGPFGVVPPKLLKQVWADPFKQGNKYSPTQERPLNNPKIWSQNMGLPDYSIIKAPSWENFTWCPEKNNITVPTKVMWRVREVQVGKGTPSSALGWRCSVLEVTTIILDSAKRLKGSRCSNYHEESWGSTFRVFVTLYFYVCVFYIYIGGFWILVSSGDWAKCPQIAPCLILDALSLMQSLLNYLRLTKNWVVTHGWVPTHSWLCRLWFATISKCELMQMWNLVSVVNLENLW